jgi:hypothetical protein
MEQKKASLADLIRSGAVKVEFRLPVGVTTQAIIGLDSTPQPLGGGSLVYEDYLERTAYEKARELVRRSAENPKPSSKMRERPLPQVCEQDPPRAGSYLLDLFLPKKHREAIVGDLEEEFRSRITPKYGRKAAICWFWIQVCREVVPASYLRIVPGIIRRFIGG